MDLVVLENKLYEILQLVELAQSDHPEDYNLDEVWKEITSILEEIS